VSEQTPLAVEVRGVTKAYGPIVALNDVSFTLRRGEIHALVGHNGAGKSTFVKVLAGVVSPDQGEVLVGAKPVTFKSPRQAQAAGIAVVEQELSLVPALTVQDNILLGRVDAFGSRSRAAFLSHVRGLLSQLGLSDVRLTTVVEDLTMAERQLVEIARALSRDARILILDEPTATLGEAEIERVFAGVRKLAAEGCSVIFVSHRLGEVLDLCSQVTVFRDGRMIASRPAAEMTRDSIVELMLGKISEKSQVETREDRASEGLVVVDGLSVPGHVEDFGLRANGGEIVAIAGQVGSGASEVLRALGGLIPDARGRVTIAGRAMRLGAPQRSVRSGVVFASNDRKGEGLFLQQSVARNLLATRLTTVSRGGFVSRRMSIALARRLAGLIGFDPKRLGAAVQTLSGGNQQKIFLGRCIEKEATVLLLFDEPTRGVDVGGRADIHNLIRHAASTGNCVIFVSSELDEIMDLADTVVTMFAGRITRIGRRQEMTAGGILAEITSGAAVKAVA
jgi:ABC-type sugar transport system ATPase subunit